MIRKVVTALIVTALVFPVGVALATPAAAAERRSCNEPTYVPSPEELLVVEWYIEFLNIRSNDACADAGRFHWVDQLVSGTPREEVLLGLLSSRRYAELQVFNAYQSILGRNPDPGAEHWTSGVQTGMAVEWVRQSLLASDEFARRHGNPLARINETYYEALGRGITSNAEADYWIDRMARVGRLAVVREIWYSPEAVRNRINFNYRALLDREVDLAGLSYWYGPQAASDVGVKASIASTEEYLANYAWKYQY